MNEPLDHAHGGNPQACSPRRGWSVRFIVLSLTSLVSVVLIVLALPGFLKARVTASGNSCINNLRMIDAAKEQWSLENKKTAGSPVIIDQVNQYIKGSATPICPQEGTYTYGAVGEHSRCTVPAHKW